MLAADLAVVVAECLGEVVALDELRRPLRHQVFVAVATLDVQARAWIATEVGGLGTGLGGRDLDSAVVIHEIQDVGELGAAVALDGDEDAVVTHFEEVAGALELDHAPQMLQPAPEGTGCIEVSL